MSDVRVATYNLYLGADLSLLFGVADLDGLAAAVQEVRRQLDATRFEERARAVASLLAREQPHLVGLQEVSRWTLAPIRSDGSLGEEAVLVDFLPTLLAALADAGCGYEAHVVNENFTGAMPVSDTQWMSLAGANVTLVRRDVEVVAARTGGFTASHRVDTGLDGVSFPIARSWGSLDVLAEGQPLRFANTHTEAYDAGVRAAQRDEVLAVCDETDGPAVLAGDLNATPDTVGVPAPWVDAWSAGAGPGHTCGQAGDLSNEQSRLSERIDYLWARDVSVVGCRLLGASPDERTRPHRLWPSDHAGVVADLRL